MPVQTAVWSYVAFTIWRLMLLPKKWALPTLRGPEWFFHLKVGTGFWQGEGRRLLQHYRMWLLAPYAVEGLVVAAIVYSGLFVKNKMWFAPNLANRRAYLWGAYLCGFLIFGILSKVGGNG